MFVFGGFAVNDLLEAKPDDRNIQAVRERLGLRLEAAYEKEKKSEVTNPLQAAIDLMALTEAEVAQWLRIFKKIDHKGKGKINFTDIFMYFEETPTEISKEVFISVDALDKDGLMEFGDFIRACGIFCMFGKPEVIK